MTSRHEYLANIIRKVHQDLRIAFKKDEDNLENIWKYHLADESGRQKYASAMLELATKWWPSDNNRITWCHQVLRDYFFEKKYTKTLSKIHKLHPYSTLEDFEGLQKILLVDVGSCYNPFSYFADIESLALDLSPATKNVFQCDFLQVEVFPDDNLEIPLQSPIITLPAMRFHAVVFSLVLEYLPAPCQRMKFFKKAADLLKIGGLLLIITPDSKAAHCNAPMMRSWQEGLERLGFHRLVYNKQPHLHCMAFVKLANISRNMLVDSNFFYIPQDANPLPLPVCVPENRTETEDQLVQDMFTSLPFVTC